MTHQQGTTLLTGSLLAPGSDVPTWPSIQVHPDEDGALTRVVGRGRVMGTDCAVHIVATDADFGFRVVGQVWSMLHTCDRLWSRFRDDSELTGLNRAPAASVQVSDLTALLVSAMVWAFDASGGIVDASVLPALIEAGYDRDFDRMAARDAWTGTDSKGSDPQVDRTGAMPTEHVLTEPELNEPALTELALNEPALNELVPNASAPGLTRVTVESGRVVRPLGLQLDSGGVGKGLAADLLAGVAKDSGAPGVLVDLGGDIRAIGCDEQGAPWRVGVADPLAPTRLPAEWTVTDAGVATSTTVKRRWGADAHHLIDPRTTKPAASDLLQVTAVAGTTLEAETWAKTALILGAGDARAWLREREIEAVLVGRDGRVEHTLGGTS